MIAAIVVTQELETVLTRRMRAKEEFDRLKAFIAGCDAEIQAGLEASVDEFANWVREVRGEVIDFEKRKLHWSDGKDNYVVYRRKGAEPRKSISPEKLLDAGVPAHVIKAATVYGEQGKPGIGIRKVTGNDPEE